MATIEMIIMAKSKKLGGKCIAGLRTDGGGWIRPVAPDPDGALFPQHYTLTDGSQAEVLDVVRIGVKGPRPEPHQPENWVISGKKWSLIARPGSEDHQAILWDNIVSGPILLGNKFDRIHISEFEEESAEASLALTFPNKIEWIIGKSVRGKRQTRATFKLKSVVYDLVVTDPDWEKNLRHLSEGSYPAKSGERFLLTISLGEPFNQYCYKLVSSVLRVE